MQVVNEVRVNSSHPVVLYWNHQTIKHIPVTWLNWCSWYHLMFRQRRPYNFFLEQFLDTQFKNLNLIQWESMMFSFEVPFLSYKFLILLFSNIIKADSSKPSLQPSLQQRWYRYPLFSGQDRDCQCSQTETSLWIQYWQGYRTQQSTL